MLGQNDTLRNIDLSTANDTTVISLIFAEHQKLSIENPLLKEEIKYYKEMNKLCQEQDSIQKEEINLYQESLSNANDKIHKLKSTQKKIIISSSVVGIILLILGLIL